MRFDTKSFGIWWICFAAIALFMVKAFVFLPPVSQLLMEGDNDDLMRLAEVRDWLAGQSWFDTHQYRVLPPDGLSMHWSRYIDAGIAGLYLTASWFLAPEMAELVAIALWPTLLACLMMLVLGHGTFRLFGRAAAVGSLAVFLGWGKLGGEFIPARIDHHNVQILCATTVFFLAILPGRPRIMGALAGAITALNLAIGLEMLPALAVIWGLMSLRHAFGQRTAGSWLVGYGLSLAIMAPLLMAGQSPASIWASSYCDVLAPPVLALAAVGIVMTLIPVLAENILRGPAARIIAILVLGAVGLWLAAPILLPCSGGPYSAVAPEVLRVIEAHVIEARSALTLLNEEPDLLFRVLLSAVIVGLLALATTVKLWGQLDPARRTALVQTFVITLVGLGFASQQIRAANLVSAAFPLLAGFLVYAFTLIPRDHRLRAPAVLLLLLVMPSTVEALVARTMTKAPAVAPERIADGTVPTAGAPLGFNTCRNQPALEEIAALPKSLIFTSMGLGPAMVAYTGHSVATAPYHRSPDAFWNGSIAFQSPENLARGLARSGADYLVICAGSTQDKALDYLQAGNLPGWLIEETGDRKRVRVFKIDKVALVNAEGTP